MSWLYNSEQFLDFMTLINELRVILSFTNPKVFTNVFFKKRTNCNHKTPGNFYKIYTDTSV